MRFSGPLACVMRFDDDDEAVSIANGTDYGLTARRSAPGSVPRQRGLRDRLEVGMVFVNNYMRRTFIGITVRRREGQWLRSENTPETLQSLCGPRTSGSRREGPRPELAAEAVT